MKSLYYHLNLIIFISISTFLVGCKDSNEKICPDPAHYHYKLEEVYKSTIPYKPNDTIVFADTAGNLLQFIAQKIDSGEIRNVLLGNPACEPSTEEYQYYNHKYIESNNNIQFQVGCYSGITTSYDNIFTPDQLRIQFNESEFFEYLHFIGVKSGPRYIPILTEGNKTFYDLNRIYITPTDTMNFAYFNEIQGVAQIKLGIVKYTLQN